MILNILSFSGPSFGKQFAWIFGDMMLYFMIYIEVVSVLENMEAMAPTSIFVKLFVRPVRRIITFQLKNLFREDADTVVTHRSEKDIFKAPPKK